MHAGQCEDGRADEGESQRPEVADAGVQIVSGQEGDRRTERGDLREREVDEDDPSLDNVHSQIRMNAGENEARQKRRDEEHQNIHYLSAFVSTSMS